MNSRSPPSEPETSELIPGLNLAAILTIVWRQKLIIVAALSISAVIVSNMVSKLPYRYDATAKLSFDRSSEVGVSAPVHSTETLNSEIYQIVSSETLARVVGEGGLAFWWCVLVEPIDQGHICADTEEMEHRYSKNKLTIDRVTSKLRGRVKASLKPKSYIVKISSFAVDGQRAALIANKVAEAYVETSLATRRRELTTFLEAHAAQITDIEAAREDLAVRMDQVRGSFGTAPEQAQIQLAEQTSVLTAKLLDKRSQGQTLRDQLSMMTDERDMQASHLFVYGQTRLQTLSRLFNEARAHYAQVSASLGPDHPERAQAKAKMQTLASQFQAEYRELKQALVNDLQVLDLETASIEAELAIVNRKTISLRKLERELQLLEAEHAAYDDLHKAKVIETAGVRASLDLLGPSAKIVVRAVAPAAKTSPQKAKLFVAGMSTATLLLIVFLYVLYLREPHTEQSEQDGLPQTRDVKGTPQPWSAQVQRLNIRS
ncbi:MAG: hypothetical protein AAFR21_16195 [Pseudomonadota bacterium]